MTSEQIAAKRAWKKAKEKHRKAIGGERTKAFAELRKAADAVLLADTNARKMRQMKKVAA